MTLCDLKKSQRAIVTDFKGSDTALITRLREIGFAEGDHVEALHFGLFGKNPMTVRLNGALIALRRQEAKVVHIKLIDQETGL